MAWTVLLGCLPVHFKLFAKTLRLMFNITSWIFSLAATSCLRQVPRTGTYRFCFCVKDAVER